MSLLSINFLHLTVSEIQPEQTFFLTPARPTTRPPAHPDTMGENNTPKALKGCWVKNLLLQKWLLVKLVSYFHLKISKDG